MGALATAQLAPSFQPPPAPESPAADWESRCQQSGFARWPHGLRAKLFRATRGHATAIAICDEIVALTHGGSLRKGVRPEWTSRIETEYFAELFGVTVRAIQDALNVLLELGLIARRTAANRAFFYQVLPWVWEALADATAGKASEAAPSPEVSKGEQTAQAVMVTSKPLVVLPGKQSRPVPLSEAVRSTLKRVRFDNYTSHNVPFEAVMRDGDLCISIRDALAGSAQFTAARKTEVIDSVGSSNRKKGKGDVTPIRNARGLAKSGPAVSTQQTSLSTAPLLARIERLRSGINDRFAVDLGALIDDAMLGNVTRALGNGSERAFFTRCDVPKQRKRVLSEGYSLLQHFAADASAITETPVAAPPAPPSVEHLPSDEGTVWATIREHLRSSVGEVNYQNWFERSRYVCIDVDHTLFVSVPDEITAQVLRDEYSARIDDAARYLRTRVRAVVFEVREQA